MSAFFTSNCSAFGSADVCSNRTTFRSAHDATYRKANMSTILGSVVTTFFCPHATAISSANWSADDAAQCAAFFATNWATIEPTDCAAHRSADSATINAAFHATNCATNFTTIKAAVNATHYVSLSPTQWATNFSAGCSSDDYSHFPADQHANSAHWTAFDATNWQANEPTDNPAVDAPFKSALKPADQSAQRPAKHAPDLSAKYTTFNEAI